MLIDSDREALMSTLQSVVSAYEVETSHHSLLGRPAPDGKVFRPVAEAIGKCKAYQEVEGHVLATANGGRIINSGALAPPLFSRAMHDVAQAAEWLLRLLSVRSADGSFKCAIWGVSIDEEIRLSESARLLPFAALSESYMKKYITGRSRQLYGQAGWLSTNLFDVPGAAFVLDAPNFPHIGRDNSPFLEFERLQGEAINFWTLLEAASVGSPLAFGYWFEYNDEDLEISAWENTLSWTFSEIAPRISAAVGVEPRTILADTRQFFALPPKCQSDLKRSMNRFVLSRCRTFLIDRILDLALAFEIAVSGESESYTAISWKVAVRTAQAIGGAIEGRQAVRRKVSALYGLRSKATHGGGMKPDEQAKNAQFVEECSDIYRRLMRSLFEIGAKPDWNVLELQSRERAVESRGSYSGK
jgi:hypothetical protein